MDLDFTYWTTIISLFIAGISCLATIIAAIPSFMQIIYKLKTNNTNNKVNVRELLSNIKKHKFEIFMFVTIILLSGVLILQLRQLNPPEKPHIPGTENKNVTCNEQDTTPLLVFAGGGSVSNMIRNTKNKSVDIKDYEKSIYLDLPSTNAWPLLAEEVMINHTSDSVTNKFYPICLSALKANSSVFHKIVDSNEFKKKGTILSYYLGKDILKIYTSEDIGEKSEVLIDELSKNVKKWCIDKSVDIFITQEGSGTYLTYQNLLKDSIDINNCKETLKWYDSKLKYSNLPQHFIVLTSANYTPKDVDDNCNGKKLKTMDKNGNKVPLSKEMYLYFAGYREEVDSKDSGTTYIVIPKEMVEFLKKIINNDAANIIKTKMYQRVQRVITPLDTLIRWEEEKNNN